MIQFYDLADAPEDVSDQTREMPILPPLPRPPVCWIGGREHVLERVPLPQVDQWAADHGLRFVRRADFGRLGSVRLYEYQRDSAPAE